MKRVQGKTLAPTCFNALNFLKKLFLNRLFPFIFYNRKQLPVIFHHIQYINRNL